MRRRDVLAAGGAGLALAALPARATPRVEAFPGAKGWAQETPGGRGGRIIPVTTLAADGPGSLAEAIAAEGPRIVVFEVGGVIDLGRRSLKVTKPFLTIAGQTGPSPGVTLIRGGMTITTHDVVVRHIRIRPGEAGAGKTSGWEADGLSTYGAADVIVDHCSLTWATDENLSASGPRFEGRGPAEWREATSRRITFSSNIVAEGLSHATHAKGEHSKGSLVHDNASDVLIVGNLYAHNRERNPLFKGGARGAVVNNLIHDPGKIAVAYNLHAAEWEGHPFETGRMSVVGNVMQAGASTDKGVALFTLRGEGDLTLHMQNNLAFNADGTTAALVGRADKTRGAIMRAEDADRWPPGLAPLPAIVVRAAILREAGARPWDRDAIDARVVAQVEAGGGRIIDSETEAGGYPAYAETRQPFRAQEWRLDDMVRMSGA